MREPREREASAHLVWIHPASGPIVALYGGRVRGGVPQRLEFLIDAPLAPSGTLDADVRHAFALVGLDDPHVP